LTNERVRTPGVPFGTPAKTNNLRNAVVGPDGGSG